MECVRRHQTEAFPAAYSPGARWRHPNDYKKGWGTTRVNALVSLLEVQTLGRARQSYARLSSASGRGAPLETAADARHRSGRVVRRLATHERRLLVVELVGRAPSSLVPLGTAARRDAAAVDADDKHDEPKHREEHDVVPALGGVRGRAATARARVT